MEPFLYVPVYDTVVCTECRFACVADEVEAHLGAAGHAARTAVERRTIAQAVQQMPGAFSNQAQLSGFRFPNPQCAANPLLQAPETDGLACRRCPYVSRQVRGIQEHCRTAHGWVNPRSRGRVLAGQATAELPWRTGVKCQRFFRTRAASGWFEVERGSRIPATTTAAVDDDDDNSDDNSRHTADGWFGMLGAYERRLTTENEDRRRIADGSAGINGDSTWVREMGWATHLAGKDMAVLYEASAGPLTAAAVAKLRDRTARDEQLLLRPLGASFDREVARCVGRLGLVPHETLRWLASIDTNKPAGRPFGVKEHPSSMERYRGYWRRYLCFCIRAYRLGRDERKTRYGIRFTDRQWARLKAVASLLAIELDMAADNNDNNNDADVDEAEVEEQARALDRAVFMFCVESLEQKVAFDVYVNPLLHFTAVLGIDGQRGGWKQAKDYTGQLAGILWCGRLLMLERVFEDQSDDPSEMGQEVEVLFKAAHRTWLADGSSSPFSTMIRWMSYGKGHRQKEGGTARVMWDEDGEALRYLGQRFTVMEFREAARAGVDEAEAVLDSLFFGQWTEARASIDLRRINDSMVYEGPGQSFATVGRNDWLLPGHRRLAALARETGALWNDRAQRWRQRRVADYAASLERFRRLHLVNTHVWGGQPGRGPEVMTMRHCDTQQLLRNVFVHDGEVLLMTDRDKNKAIRGIGRKVARFLPARVGLMMVAYIVWVLPFERMLHASVGGSRFRPLRAELDEWLWKDGSKGRWETTELSEQLKQLTGRHIGVPLTVADYRHVAIELGRQIRGLVVRQLEVNIGADDDYDNGDGGGEADPATGEAREQRRWDYIWDLQATHGSAIAQQHYALDIRFPGQLQPAMIASYRGISRLWHGYIGFHHDGKVDNDSAARRRHKRKASIEWDGGRGGSKRERHSLTLTLTSTSTSTSTMTARTNEERAVVEHDAEWATTGLRKLLGPNARWKLPEQRESVVKVMAMGDGQVLIVVLPTGSGKSILFMLPAVAETAGTTVVVVPFVALMDDLAARARDLGVDCLRWVPAARAGRDEPHRSARLVVVSAEVAACAEFTSYADGLRARGLLRRIFVDECHTIIMDSGYRARLAALKGLHRFDCPVVLLTATLPVRLERWFRQVMIAEDAEMVRAATVKRNIRYTVTTVKPGRGAVEDEAVRTARVLERGMRGIQKGVVYCRSKKACETLAAKLGCDFYHSSVADELRQDRLRRWADRDNKDDNDDNDNDDNDNDHNSDSDNDSDSDGEREKATRWIVATTGLGTGVDIRGIVAVLHAEAPYGLVDFVQQTGRGGRQEGEVVESVVITDGRPARYTEPGSDVEQLNRQAMAWFLQTVDCRRVGLGTFMDGGTGLDCDEARGERCDRCRSRQLQQSTTTTTTTTHKRAIQGGRVRHDEQAATAVMDVERETGPRPGPGPKANRLKAHTKKQHGRVHALHAWLRAVEGRCGVCYIRWCRYGQDERTKGQFEHGPAACRTVRIANYIRWRKKLRFGESSCCWWCGLPQGWCRREGQEVGCEQESREQEGEGEGGKTRCVWADQVLRVVMLAQHSRTMGRMVKEEFGVQVDEEKDYIEWLGRTRQMYGETTTNAVAVWDLIVIQYIELYTK
ncbi:hypothetical protein HD806DRAFT_492673 [Xylariaceae sp. AK1471]|nr:hypothetical protein HD806DRAFT_515638 [Xylariaceae sp. AK1471]KAI3317328.1 hypothetical protein HD806DRAFT_370901 [Xylariaceae sp. AK1471]KAI3325336.1 hypothetical protein HD806DRAFT_492673 [Xylariaceae sp. AK1471]